MPKTLIDYSKTIIYKICCKDPTITDIYIGHTTNLTKRRNGHKTTCNNLNSKNYHLYVYEFIRNNGGWNNWSLIPIEECNLNNQNEALQKERYWLEELKATLNKNIPLRTIKEWRNNNENILKEKRKEKYKINQDKILEKAKEYREINQEIINEKAKEYREINQEIINEKAKEYYKINKEIINEKRKDKYICDCGSSCRISDKIRHLKSKKHQEFIKSNINI